MPPRREGWPSSSGVSSLCSPRLSFGSRLSTVHGILFRRGSAASFAAKPLGNHRINDGAVAGNQRALDELVVPVNGERLLLLIDQRLDKGLQVAGIEARGIDRYRARQIELAKNAHAVVLGDLAWLRELSIAAALSCKIDDDRARLYACDHRLGDELRRRSPR